VPEIFATIATALGAAEPGDVVDVADGTWHEHGLVLRDGVALRSRSGDPGRTIIDGEGQGQVLLCSNPSTEVTITGLTFTRGMPAGDSGAERAALVGASGGGLRLISCRFADTDSALPAPGVVVQTSTFDAYDCAFDRTGGNGLEVYASGSTLRNCTASFNQGNGIVSVSGERYFEYCVLSGNRKSGIALEDHGSTGSVRVEGGTVSGNREGGISGSNLVSLTVSDCEIAENGHSGLTVYYSSIDLYRTNFRANLGPGVQVYGMDILAVDCRFEENLGGGMQSESGAVKLEGCVFTGNRAGGLSSRLSSVTSLTGCTFSGNRGGYRGGGAWIGSGEARVRGCTFFRNSCQESGGGLAVDYGTAIDLESCLFEGNEASLGGGAVIEPGSGARVFGCDFLRNRAGHGGGASLGPVQVEQCLFSANEGDMGAGGVLATGGGVFRYCRFIANRAGVEGGGAVRDSGSVFVNCTFHRNGAARGSSILAASGTTITSTILSGGEGGPAAANLGAGSVRLSFSDVWDNEGGNYVGAFEGQDASDGNLELDPRYCFPPEDLGLAFDSPCLAEHTGCGLIGALGRHWNCGR